MHPYLMQRLIKDRGKDLVINVGFEDNGDSVTALFEDGSSATGRLLVGADGANSRIRKQYLPGATQTETGLIAIGGKQALTDSVRHQLPPAARNMATGMQRVRESELEST